jgi:hypothetical protein
MMPSENETLPACNSRSLLHLLNPGPALDTTGTGNQAFENVPPNEFEPMDVDPPSQADYDIGECESSASPCVQVEASVNLGEANGLPQAELEDSGENKKNLKRTAPDDNEITPPAQKGPKPDRDYQDLREALSFRRGLKPIVNSTLWSRIQNRRFHVGDFISSSERDLKFHNKILELDPNSTILNPKTVRHFKCAKELKMKEPYNAGNFRKHIKTCKGTPKSHKLPAGGMKTLDNFFAKPQVGSKTNSSSKPFIVSSKPSIIFPCPGLREASYPKILNYLERTGAHGGGGPSVSSLAVELFGKKYRNLSRSRKQQVKMAQHHEWLWRNHHTEGTLYSTKCTKEAASAVPVARDNTSSSTSSSDPQLLPCKNCNALFELKAFKNILHKPQPDDKNYKYTNIEYHNERMASLFGRCTGLREIIEVSIFSPANCRLISFNRISPIVQ